MIKGHFSDHFVLAVKDQIRSVRFRIRRSADGDEARGNQRRPSRVPRPVALAANAVFTQVESGARALLPDPGSDPGALAFPLPLQAYFGAGDRGQEPGQAFTIGIYRALKRLLRRFGAREFLVFEQAIGEVHAEICQEEAGLIAAACGVSSAASRAPPITRLCAALAVRLAAAQPVKEMLLDPIGDATPRHLKPSPNEYCACVVGLATAIVSLHLDTEAADQYASGLQGRDWIVESADMAVDARFERFAAALKSADPVTGLTAEFAAVLPFLP
jgi:hypothetical protein